jgi:hypothetical protein
MTAEQPPRRVITVPVYWVAVIMFSVAAMVVVSAVISTALADRNARALVARYEADKRATAEGNRAFYCALFGSQLEAFSDASSPAGKKSYDGWLGVYRLAKCEPIR